MSRPGRALRALRKLSWTQRRLAAQAWLLLPLTAAGLRILGFQRVLAIVVRVDAPPACGVDVAAAQAVARLVHGAGNWSPFHANCLPRALVLCRLLRLQGLAANLRVGVARPGGTFAAHAWVEHGGVALAEAESVSERYASFDDIHEIKSA